MIEVAEVKDQLRKFIAETSFIPEENVKNETLIFQEGIFDSMGFLSLINFIEDHFQIKADDSELLEDNFESVNAVAEFIAKKLN